MPLKNLNLLGGLMKMRVRKALLLVPLFILLIVPPTSGALLVQLDSVTPDGNLFPGDYYRWSYSVTIGNGDVVCVSASNCFFTIYDFGPIYTVSAAWSARSVLLGFTPTGVTPTDSPTVPNITFYLSGILTDPIVGIGQTITGFNVYSTLGNFVATGQYSWQDQNASALIQNGLGEVGVPSATSSPVPEPSTMLLLGSGLLGVLGFRGRFRKQVK